MRATDTSRLRSYKKPFACRDRRFDLAGLKGYGFPPWAKPIPAALIALLASSLPAAGAEEAAAAGSIWDQAIAGEPEEFGGLDIDQLSQVRVISSTLTPTQVRLVPAKTTVLDETVIAQSGARHLNELLEIYAPNTQLIAHNTHLDHFGFRGIISDRDDKYLLRVNGKVMNNRYFSGAESERDLPMLGDFRSVTAIHGPASATYGAGALAGVLNLETYNGLNFQGADAQVRHVFGDEFTVGEARYGQKFTEDSGLFLYAGVADQKGANQSDSPLVYGKSFVTPGATPDVFSGQPVTFAVPNSHDAGGMLKMKFHASYVNGPAEIWARYTQGGGLLRPQRSNLLASADFSAALTGHRNMSEQFTIGTKYKKDLSDVFNLETFVSYNQYLYRLWLYDVYPMSDDRREREAYGRVLGTWTPNKNHSVALGLEYSHLWLDGASASAQAVGQLPPHDAWQTDTVSLLAEHQWHLNDQWTTFASARMDKHTYTDWLFSPRLALAFTPTSQDTLKLIAARAKRRSGDGELRQEYVQTNAQGSTESLDSLEFRYERQQSQHLNFGVSVFHEENQAIGFSQVLNHSIPVGTFRIWGIEPEITFRSENTRLTLSHGYTKLLGSSLATSSTIQGISAEPYGYGHDLANWANNITKLALIQEFNREWTASTSLRVYWGFPGAEALAAWNGGRSSPLGFALADPGYSKAYGQSVYWNAGLEYRPVKNLTLRADAYDILGWADKTLNKRLYYFRGSDYSSEAASVGLSVRLAF